MPRLTTFDNKGKVVTETSPDPTIRNNSMYKLIEKTGSNYLTALGSHTDSFKSSQHN